MTRDFNFQWISGLREIREGNTNTKNHFQTQSDIPRLVCVCVCVRVRVCAVRSFISVDGLRERRANPCRCSPKSNTKPWQGMKPPLSLSEQLIWYQWRQFKSVSYILLHTLAAHQMWKWSVGSLSASSVCFYTLFWFLWSKCSTMWKRSGSHWSESVWAESKKIGREPHGVMFPKLPVLEHGRSQEM